MLKCSNPIKVKYHKYSFLDKERFLKVYDNYRLSFVSDDKVRHYASKHSKNHYIEIDDEVCKDFRFLYVPCGRCYSCITSNANMWSFRLSSEIQNKNAIMLTLTFSDENYIDPSDSKSEFYYKHQIQKFIKRMRKHLIPYKSEFDGKFTKKYLKSIRFQLKLQPFRDNFKYFYVGEYGTLHRRFHYHIILTGFNHSKKRLALLAKKLWRFGIVHSVSCNSACCNYVARYLVKDPYIYLKKSDYKLKTGRFRPFRAMSQSLGKDYLLSNFYNILQYKFIHHYGIRIPLPKTFKFWIRQILGSDKYNKEIKDYFNRNKVFEFMQFLAKHDLEHFKDIYYDDDLSFNIEVSTIYKDALTHYISAVNYDNKVKFDDLIRKNYEKRLKKSVFLGNIA